MKKKMFAKLFYSGAFCLSLFFASCGKEETPPVNNGGMSQKMDEEGLTDKQKENALPLKGKVFGELPIVGEEDAIYCNLPENVLSWDSSIPLCRDPLYDILYYVDENIIYAVQNGKTEAAVELSGSRLFCRGGKLYFLLNSNTGIAVKGAKSGNILCYNPVDGTVEVVLDDVFDSITVYQDLIYCRKIGEEDTGFSVDMSYWFYFFDTKELIAQKKQEKFSYTVGIARYGKDFVGKLYGLYDRSKPIEYLEELIKQGADPNFKVPIGAHLCEFDGSNSRVLEGIKELPISHYVKENNLIWLSEDGLHTWNIVTGKEEITEFQYIEASFILLDDKLYSTRGYMENGEQKKCCEFALKTSTNGIGQIGEFFTDKKQVYGYVAESMNEDGTIPYRLYLIDVISKEKAVSMIPSDLLGIWEESLNDCDCVYRLTELSKE